MAKSQSNQELVLIKINPLVLNSNELTLIRLGEDPEKFDHYVMKKMKSSKKRKYLI